MAASNDRPYQFAAQRLLEGKSPSGVDLDQYFDFCPHLEWTVDELWRHFHREYHPEMDEPIERYLTEAARFENIGDFISVPRDQLSLLAAFGLIAIDRFIQNIGPESLNWEAFHQWAQVAECAEYVRYEPPNGYHVAEIVAWHRRQRGRELANLRHSTGPTAEARAFARECWERWQKSPKDYKSGAEFARAMVDKFPDSVVERTVTSWVTAWRKGGT